MTEPKIASSFDVTNRHGVVHVVMTCEGETIIRALSDDDTLEIIEALLDKLRAAKRGRIRK